MRVMTGKKDVGVRVIGIGRKLHEQQRAVHRQSQQHDGEERNTTA